MTNEYFAQGIRYLCRIPTPVLLAERPTPQNGGMTFRDVKQLPGVAREYFAVVNLWKHEMSKNTKCCLVLLFHWVIKLN